MTLVNDLTKARTLIAECGLTKGAFNLYADGSLCTIGAVVKAAGHHFENEYAPWEAPAVVPSLEALFDTLQEMQPLEEYAVDSLPIRRQRIYLFNDADETTQADVLGLFDTTIARVALKAKVSK